MGKPLKEESILKQDVSLPSSVGSFVRAPRDVCHFCRDQFEASQRVMRRSRARMKATKESQDRHFDPHLLGHVPVYPMYSYLSHEEDRPQKIVNTHCNSFPLSSLNQTA